MPGFGYGYGFGAYRQKRRLTPAAPPVAGVLTPSASWNGIGGSGYTVTPTADPRSVAKPALRLLVPPNQYYSDKLVVGFACAANDNGNLLNMLGIAKIVVSYEGNSLEITAPSYKTLPDANGVNRVYLGWWCELARANATNGDALLYAEAYARNGLFQRRLEGPHQFSPRTFAATGDKHDFKLTVAPSQAQITGVRYQTVQAANTYLVAQAAQNPLVTITEAGTHDITAVAATYEPNGRFGLTASQPITIGKAAFTTNTAANLRSRINGLHVFGANVTVDYKNIAVIFRETGGTRQHWMDGIRLTDSLGRGRLWLGGTRAQVAGWCVAGNAWFTECMVDNLPNPGVNASLIRGGIWSEGYGDTASDAACIVGLVCNDWSNSAYANDLDSFRVEYSGVEASATLSLDANGAGSFLNGNDAASRRWTLKWGSNSATFTVARAEGSANYWPSQVVNWINGLAITGMVATLLDDTRRATYCSLRGLKGVAFNDTNIKGAPLTVVTMIDLHNDFWQTVAFNENALLYDIKIRDFVGAILFPTAATGLRDAIIFNMASYNSPTSTAYDINADTFSQFSQAHSHVFVAHCSLSNQGVRLQANYTADGYCMFAANSFRSFLWLGTVDNDLGIKDTHLHAGYTNPTNGVGTTIGGDETSLYLDAANANWAPAGALLSNLKPSVVQFDINRKPRGANDTAGAMAA